MMMMMSFKKWAASKPPVQTKRVSNLLILIAFLPLFAAVETISIKEGKYVHAHISLSWSSSYVAKKI